MTTENAPLAGEDLLDAINQHVYLVVLNISWPKMAYAISDAVVEIEDEDVKLPVAAKFRNKPQWKLLPEHWKKRFTKLESHARSALHRPGVATATRGMALLPITKAETVFATLRDYRAQMETCINEFADVYSDVLQNLRDELGMALYLKAAKKLPTVDSIRHAASIRWSIMPLGDGIRLSVTRAAVQRVQQILHDMRDLAEDTIAADEYDAAQETMTTLVTELSNPVNRIGDESAGALIREAREQFNQYALQMVDDMAREPRKELEKAIDHLLESVQTGRQIKQGTLNAITQSFELVRNFSFLADDELLQRINTCETELNRVTVQHINSCSSIGHTLATALSQVRERAANEQARDTAVRQFRGVRIQSAPTPKDLAAAASP